MLEFLPFINLILNLVLVIGGYLVKSFFETYNKELAELRKMGAELEIRLRSIEMTYVPRSELRSMFGDILEGIKVMNSKMDRQ